MISQPTCLYATCKLMQITAYKTYKNEISVSQFVPQLPTF